MHRAFAAFSPVGHELWWWEFALNGKRSRDGSRLAEKAVYGQTSGLPGVEARLYKTWFGEDRI
jgi:hypothetical protein